ncbi:hypothetical protein ACFQS7_03980 [Dankookia sp. GCM10030260]|uniref:hypothetical protein n=1 Tax=Dankookia sp. GCM10030260 TaxID=3273390 RepID=UPI003620960D
MRAPLWLSLFLLLLVVSVAGKVVAGTQSLSGVEEALKNTAMGAERVASFLERQGFRVGEVESMPDVPLVLATSGGCRLVTVLAAPQGWHRDITHQFASAGDQVFFVFDATIYQDQPKWPPWVHHYWQVLNYYVGRRVPTRPVLGIVASAACDLRGMPWREIAELP